MNRTSTPTSGVNPKSKSLRIGITGSPGTGKKTLGELLSKKLDEEYTSINDFAVSKKYGKQVGQEFNVDVRKLRGKIRTQGRVISGHLLPYLVANKDLDLVIVLRCSPKILRGRYEQRGYSEAKIRENLESELIGVVAAKCLKEYSFKKLAEFNTSRTNAETISKRVLDIIKGRTKPVFGNIDWLSTLTVESLERNSRQNHRFNIP